MKTKKKGLGKGLDALLGSTIASTTQPVYVNQGTPSETAYLAPALKTGVLLEVPVELCQRGKYQPRRDIDQASLDELAASIRNQGVMQPIILRALEGDQANDQSYEIIAGERRWRAAQQAGLMTVPAVIKDVEDETAMAMALVENLQREDLNPMEEAYALARLNQEFDLTHQQVADIVGKSRVAVSNMLRLMNLVDEVKRMLEHGDIEMGHARALLGLVGEQQLTAATEVVNRSLNVRQTELLVKNYNKTALGVETAPADPNTRVLENQLGEKFGLPVSITHNSKGAGKLTIKYHSLDELDGILDHIK
ncbi:MAG: ParB/RepB/Spo0J family partition protein [Pseudomonadota bacterium]|nr:ParB/RepB/Spo0J family partition protein [Pseudomonadota bacterium]